MTRKYTQGRKTVQKDRKIFRIVILVTAVLLLFFVWSVRKSLMSFSRYGYLGVFLVNFVSNATVLLPIPGIASVFFGGAVWNPVAVGVISGLGAAFGELFSYFLGYGGRGVLQLLDHKVAWTRQVEYLFHKTGFLAVFVFSLLPIPIFDFLGILAGSLNYPVWKFALATFFGRSLRNLFIALMGAKFLSV